MVHMSVKMFIILATLEDKNVFTYMNQKEFGKYPESPVDIEFHTRVTHNIKYM